MGLTIAKGEKLEQVKTSWRNMRTTISYAENGLPWITTLIPQYTCVPIHFIKKHFHFKVQNSSWQSFRNDMMTKLTCGVADIFPATLLVLGIYLNKLYIQTTVPLEAPELQLSIPLVNLGWWSEVTFIYRAPQNRYVSLCMVQAT